MGLNIGNPATPVKVTAPANVPTYPEPADKSVPNDNVTANRVPASVNPTGIAVTENLSNKEGRSPLPTAKEGAQPNRRSPLPIALRVKKVHADAKLPTVATTGSAGIDLYSIGDWTLTKGVVMGIGTGISVAIPEGFVGILRDRSGMAKKGVTLGGALERWYARNQMECPYDPALGGTIDSDYRGELIVLLINLSDTPYSIKKGDRIAQMILLASSPPTIADMDVVVTESLTNTARADGGFGSTGK